MILSKFNSIFCLFLAFNICYGDVYFHNLRGSNNRLNEKSAARKNANRMFDSQNNNRGGYNVGDKGSDPGEQYEMFYFQGSPDSKAGKSELVFEWTNQHGCGGSEDKDPHKQNCNIVLQYMCQPETATINKLRNGEVTNTQDYKQPPNGQETPQGYKNRKAQSEKQNRGLHEPFEWFDYCVVRNRNKGLFTADQELDDDYSVYTRQNPDGNQYGYECPEEKDYYPYFHPNPWKDIAVLTDTIERCNYFQTESHNVKSRGACVNKQYAFLYNQFNNEADCKNNKLEWIEFHNFLEKATNLKNKNDCLKKNYIWGYPSDFYTSPNLKEECLVPLSKPECINAPWTRSNHLGNSREARASNYTWFLPHFPSETTQRCVARIRYNISTDDYDPYQTDAKYNDLGKNGLSKSPVRNNPVISIPSAKRGLRLAINTQQFGRTFQDRSHTFLLRPRPTEIAKKRIVNLNVRGKRGNIVQVYPAVEYDFIPNNAEINSKDDVVHLQWTGSNTHNNGKDGGDGQTGDDGQGQAGTDRNNLVEILDRNHNFPVAYEKSTLWKNSEIVWSYFTSNKLNAADFALNAASSGYYQCFNASICGPESVQSKAAMNNLLNNAPASYPGLILKIKPGVYHYACTRNNNFSNRSQKGTIVVK